MSGPDDPDAAYAAKILEFDEDEVDNYAQAVQSNFRSAINKNVPVNDTSRWVTSGVEKTSQRALGVRARTATWRAPQPPSSVSQ